MQDLKLFEGGMRCRFPSLIVKAASLGRESSKKQKQDAARRIDCCQKELWRSRLIFVVGRKVQEWQQVLGFYKEKGGVDMATRQLSLYFSVRRRFELTWTQTRRFAAWCCLGGSGAAFCTCLCLLWRSQRAACRSESSWCRLGLQPAPSSEPEQTEVDEWIADRAGRSCILTAVHQPWFIGWPSYLQLLLHALVLLGFSDALLFTAVVGDAVARELGAARVGCFILFVVFGRRWGRHRSLQLLPRLFQVLLCRKSLKGKKATIKNVLPSPTFNLKTHKSCWFYYELNHSTSVWKMSRQ